ncbi:GrpB family protein [Paenibacillus guangzhouensis]|uniref:GrpB family protein n=1 Tax=Paenibacillus guangzhouensis TaxID=1473112 RepID=UPI001266B13E|nr:GrpB family protein [Paenibacillus guangzhouensis]
MDFIEVVAYKQEWHDQFLVLAGELRRALGETAMRIDHIGSTSVAGLAAKPIIDIQISVRCLQTMEQYQIALENAGYRYHSDNDDLSKRYFREGPENPRIHIHVREAGSWSEQLNLLFRDYLREQPEACKKYEEVKYGLAERYRNDREAYVRGKEEVVWAILRQAHGWSMHEGWKPGVSDA